MSLLRNITSGLRSLFRKDQVDRELDEELGAYLEMEAAEKMKEGMTRKDAVRTVRLERGSLEITREVVRSGGWESLVDTLWRDLGALRCPHAPQESGFNCSCRHRVGAWHLPEHDGIQLRECFAAPPT